jgi:hypothetical protein
MAHKYKYKKTPAKTIGLHGSNPHLHAYDSVYMLGLNSEGDTLFAARWGKHWVVYRVFNSGINPDNGHAGQTGGTYKTLNDIESAWHEGKID